MPWCKKGHELLSDDKFCSICGEDRITKCPNGHDFRPIFDSQHGIENRPNACHECGTRYSWFDEQEITF